MTAFEEFIKTNSIRKKELAEYLGIGPSTITYYCKGATLPDSHIVRLAEKWDVSVLKKGNTPGEAPACRDKDIALLREEVAVLRQIVENQSAVIAGYGAIIKELARRNG